MEQKSHQEKRSQIDGRIGSIDKLRSGVILSLSLSQLGDSYLGGVIQPTNLGGL